MIRLFALMTLGLCFPYFIRSQTSPAAPAGPVPVDSPLERLKSLLDERQISWEKGRIYPFEDVFDTAEEGKAPSVFIRIPAKNRPENEEPWTFVLLCPLNEEEGKFLFSTETALAFVREITAMEEIPADCFAAFPGGEDAPPEGEEVFPAADSIINDPFYTLIFRLEPAERPGSLVFRHGTESSLVQLDMLKPLPRLCNEENMAYSFGEPAELLRLGIAESSPCLRRLQSQGFRALQAEAREGSHPIDPEALGRLIARYAVQRGIYRDDSSLHYNFLTLAGHTFFLSEGLILTAFLFCNACGLVWFITTVLRKGRKHRSPPAEIFGAAALFSMNAEMFIALAVNIIYLPFLLGAFLLLLLGRILKNPVLVWICAILAPLPLMLLPLLYRDGFPAYLKLLADAGHRRLLFAALLILPFLLLLLRALALSLATMKNRE
ncbi:MAG: hypothetical protein LBG22_06055 [Treponema sp.]|nr:hypothetical protein [Treponema sp.]